MGLHPSIRSLLAANAGFTTGNVTSRQKQSLSLSPEIKQFFMLADPGRAGPLFGGRRGCAARQHLPPARAEEPRPGHRLPRLPQHLRCSPACAAPRKPPPCEARLI